MQFDNCGWPDGKPLKRRRLGPKGLAVKKQRLWQTSGKCCWYCATPLTLGQARLEHMTPRSRGGGHDVGNLAIACRDCDERKGARTPLEFFAGINP